jgi:hypothetical protein
MAKIDLRVRDLNTGVASIMVFETEQAATAWLTARPKFTEVLGVGSMSIEHDMDMRLRAALRPLEDDEKALEQKLGSAATAKVRERQEAELKKSQAAEEAHKNAMKTADPNRLMEVHWTFNAGMSLSDPSDGRAISDEVRDAVMAWVRERDEWVESRGQVVGDAKVTVWPNTVPKGEERVKRGTFIPVTAPAKK